jgi:peptide methionine sulfoxide reductase msrA/msrB
MDVRMPARAKTAVFFLATLMGLAGWRGLNLLLGGNPIRPASVPGEMEMAKKVKKTDTEWKELLTPEQYRVMRQGDTEKPFSGKYNDFWEEGLYACAGCGTPLFRSEAKYDHGTGWPSFTVPVSDKNLVFKDDYSLLMKRVEVRCAVCGAHLGHVFDDGPGPTYLHYCINSASLNFIPAGAAGSGPEKKTPSRSRSKARAGTREESAGAEKATFAAGCFWGVEDKLGKIPGVLSTVVGYTGGRTADPTYEEVCTDKTGHAEAVEVTFDPSQVSYEELVRRFFDIHDPTQVNRQGPDSGTQYRSAIFYHDEKQRATAAGVMAELKESGRFKKPLATELTAAAAFYRAEEYHQKYFEKHGVVCH